MWARPTDAMNSIGNLMLHLAGNVRQYLVSGIGGAKDVRERPKEFSERGPIPRTELLARLETTVAEAQAALKKTPAEDFLRPRPIQSSTINGFDALFTSVPHFRGHTQEIIHMTRDLLGEKYQFAWTPTMPAVKG